MKSALRQVVRKKHAAFSAACFCYLLFTKMCFLVSKYDTGMGYLPISEARVMRSFFISVAGTVTSVVSTVICIGVMPR